MQVSYGKIRGRYGGQCTQNGGGVAEETHFMDEVVVEKGFDECEMRGLESRVWGT